MNKELLGAVWTFLSITLGAGIFGLPYVFSKAGFYTGLCILIFVALLVSFISLYLGEIILRTRGKHQLTGLAGIYLGKHGKLLMFLINVLSIYGALAIYIVGAGEALFALFGGNVTLHFLLFFVFVAPVVYFGVKFLDKFESVFTPLKVVIILLLSFFLLRYFHFSNLHGFSFSKLLVPYGAAIFAFTGISALPTMHEELRNKKLLFWAIILGMILTLIINLFFVFVTVGALSTVQEVATVSLSDLNKNISFFSNIFVLFAMATAFVALGFALKENFTLDYKFGNFVSWLVVVFVPLILVLTGFFGFSRILELTGGFTLGLLFLLILVMHSKARKFGFRDPEYIMPKSIILKILFALFILVGVVYSLFF